MDIATARWLLRRSSSAAKYLGAFASASSNEMRRVGTERTGTPAAEDDPEDDPEDGSEAGGSIVLRSIRSVTVPTLDDLRKSLNPSFPRFLRYDPHVSVDTDQPEQRDASKGAQTRRAVLDAAIARFGRDGYRTTSVADIARDAGVGGTVAYSYFPNKEALFLAAVDEDAAGVISEGFLSTLDDRDLRDWQAQLIVTLVGAVERHPLARRLLAGLEPDVTVRVLEIPALAEVRKVCTERLRSDQAAGAVRSDIDPESLGNGLVSIMLSILMSVVQLGNDVAGTYAPDVIAVISAAIDPLDRPARRA